jgi:copper chaperone NosL
MRRWIAIAALMLNSCGGGPPAPADIAMSQDACVHCRMAIVSRSTAAQIARRGDEPRFFDEIACLRDYLRNAPLPGDAMVYVADHRTGAWVDARNAVFTRTSASTPMASGYLAHDSAASRDADPDTAGGAPATVTDVLGSVERSPAP